MSCIGTEWQDTSRHLIEHDTKRIEIAAFIAWIARGLFRRNVEGRTELCAGQSTSQSTEHFGYTEISQNRLPHRIDSRIAAIKQDISRLDIAMDHTILMGISTARLMKINRLTSSVGVGIWP